MKNNVVIVESPAKSKTITKFLGPGYTVLASFGHVRAIPRKQGMVDTGNEPRAEMPSIRTAKPIVSFMT